MSQPLGIDLWEYLYSSGRRWKSLAYLLLFLTWVAGGSAVAGLLGSYTLFTGVDGVVTKNGDPVAGVRIVQSAKLGAKSPVSQETTTDQNGRFSLPEIKQSKGLGSLLPQQFAVGQELLIYESGQEHVGWILTKFDPENGSETGQNPIRLICELTADPSGGEKHVGICRLAND